ncbi:hypothetical protein Dda_4097 [Drechslerella dactyloides]|uniref:Uncharacterized protein n=1 Tax=Drechslerella dactyloides TaxID=74499 RepID=A0AAD6NKD3_DREDA|nr:hypothetical protein Dda_4097 [Drechslerella dactyloides]
MKLPSPAREPCATRLETVRIGKLIGFVIVSLVDVCFCATCSSPPWESGAICGLLFQDGGRNRIRTKDSENESTEAGSARRVTAEAVVTIIDVEFDSLDEGEWVRSMSLSSSIEADVSRREVDATVLELRWEKERATT